MRNGTLGSTAGWGDPPGRTSQALLVARSSPSRALCTSWSISAVASASRSQFTCQHPSHGRSFKRRLQEAANGTHGRLPRQPQIAEPTSRRATTINTLVIIVFSPRPLCANQRFARRHFGWAEHNAASRAPELSKTEDFGYGLGKAARPCGTHGNGYQLVPFVPGHGRFSTRSGAQVNSSSFVFAPFF